MSNFAVWEMIITQRAMNPETEQIQDIYSALSVVQSDLTQEAAVKLAESNASYKVFEKLSDRWRML